MTTNNKAGLIFSNQIRDIIKQGIEVPEQQNDLRRQQLRELALLNGTLRENDGLMKLKQLQQAQTIITNNILCAKCGGTGHLTQDCKQARSVITSEMMQCSGYIQGFVLSMENLEKHGIQLPVFHTGL